MLTRAKTKEGEAKGRRVKRFDWIRSIEKGRACYSRLRCTRLAEGTGPSIRLDTTGYKSTLHGTVTTLARVFTRGREGRAWGECTIHSCERQQRQGKERGRKAGTGEHPKRQTLAPPHNCVLAKVSEFWQGLSRYAFEEARKTVAAY